MFKRDCCFLIVIIARGWMIIARDRNIFARGWMIIARHRYIIARERTIIARGWMIVARHRYIIARERTIFARDRTIFARDTPIMSVSFTQLHIQAHYLTSRQQLLNKKPIIKRPFISNRLLTKDLFLKTFKLPKSYIF